jgi:hypothetical protein
MRFKVIPAFVALALIAGLVVVTLSLSAGVASVSASSGKNGQLHLAKECTEYTGLPGGFCTFTSSNLKQIPVLSKVYYDQAPGIPTGLLDSNVVLDAEGGNRAVGRCTLDFSTGRGLCTFADGTGDLTGFEARVDVDCPGDGVHCTWDGTYSFNPKPRR